MTPLRTLFVGSLILGLYFFRHARLWTADGVGGHDWDAAGFFLEAVVLPIRQFGQFPFWNPYYMSGLPVFANPQTKLFCPTVLLGIFMDTRIALKVATVAYGLAGFPIMAYFLGSVLRLRASAALLGVVLFSASSFFVLHLYAGHANFVALPLLPLAVAWFVRALQGLPQSVRSLRESLTFLLQPAPAWRVWAFLGGAASILVLVVEEGGVHLVLLFLFAGGLGAALVSVQRHDVRPLLLAAGVLALFAPLVAHRAVPAWMFLAEHGRFYRPEAPALMASQLLAMFTTSVRDPSAHLTPEWPYSWWEYGNYVGWYGIAGFAVLLLFARRRDWPLGVLLVLLLLLCLGPFSVWSPAALLRELPVLRNQTVHSRWGVVVVWLLALWAAVLLDRALGVLEVWAKNALPGRLLVAAIPLFLSLLLYSGMQRASAPLVGRFFPLELPAMMAGPQLETVARAAGYGAASAMWPAVRNNRSTRDGYELLTSPNRAIAVGERGYTGEFHLEQARTRVTPLRWTPNEVEFSIILTKPDVLIINQNYLPGWLTRPALPLADRGGRLAVRLAAGRTQFVFRFVDPVALGLSLFSLGCFLALFSLAVACWWRERRAANISLSGQ